MQNVGSINGNFSSGIREIVEFNSHSFLVSCDEDRILFAYMSGNAQNNKNKNIVHIDCLARRSEILN